MRRTLAAAFMLAALMIGPGGGMALADPPADEAGAATTSATGPPGQPTADAPADKTPAEVPTTSAVPTTTTAPISTLPTTTVAAPADSNEVGSLTFYTTWQMGPVPGVVAEIVDNDTGAHAGTMTTGADGTVRKELPFGSYTVAVTSVPAGFTALKQPTTDVTWIGANARDVQMSFLFDNAAAPAPHPAGTLVKRDRITGAALAGAAFDITDCNKTEPTFRVVTGPDGTVPLSTAPGCHQAIEVTAPAGYQLETTPTYFDLNQQDTFVVTAMPIEAPTVSRNPAGRTPIRAIPSGPIHNP